MGLFGPGQEYCNQLFFRDDDSFLIRKLPIIDKAIMEKDGDQVKYAWMMPYKLLKDFKGFKAIKECKLLICFGRDVVLDAFNQLHDEEKPERGPSLIKKMTTAEAESVVYRHEKGKKSSVIDKMVLFTGAIMVILGIAIFVVAAT